LLFQLFDFLVETAAPARNVQGAPYRRQPHGTLAEGIPEKVQTKKSRNPPESELQ
jgi:hypothetical protein